jgi:hypothetical protein
MIAKDDQIEKLKTGESIRILCHYKIVYNEVFLYTDNIDAFLFNFLSDADYDLFVKISEIKEGGETFNSPQDYDNVTGTLYI